jgi:hypothetical protein
MYRTYSMAILWNLGVADLNRQTIMGLEPLPVDGDALARSSARIRKNTEAWKTLAADVLGRLQTNGADSDKVAAL